MEGQGHGVYRNVAKSRGDVSCLHAVYLSMRADWGSYATDVRQFV